jgi:hypothetical protein
VTEDFHDYEWKLGRFKERLKKESFSMKDQSLILDSARAEASAEMSPSMMSFSNCARFRLLVRPRE